MLTFKSATLVGCLGLSLSGCTAVIPQASFYRSASLAAPDAVLKVRQRAIS